MTQVDAASGSIDYLTTGSDFMVTSVFGYDDASGVVSFRGTEQGDPGTIHTYTVKDDGSEFTCVTCDTAMPDQRFQCKDNSVQFSPDRQHYLHR